MSVLAVVTCASDIDYVLVWSAHLAEGRNTDLIVLCWAKTPTAQFPLLAEDEDLNEVEELAQLVEQRLDDLPIEEVSIRRALHPDVSTAAIKEIRRSKPSLVVAASPDPSGAKGATYGSNPLMRKSPCDTLVLCFDA